MKEGLVSIVIPTKNSGVFLENTLKSIAKQLYTPVETIIVDGKSTDKTLSIAHKYKARVLTYVPNVSKGIFDAPHKRNYGMARSNGEYVYWLDADMELPIHLISEAVLLCTKSADAVILHEDSFGNGIWAQAKKLERSCYWGDDLVESPRFFKKSVWKNIGGFDLSLGAGGDDIDLTQKLLEKNYRIYRAKSIVRHNEGDLSIIKLCKKRYMYGKEMLRYLHKRPKSWITSYNPIKGAYIRNWRQFLRHPVITIAFIVMRMAEYISGMAGLITSFPNVIKVPEATPIIEDYSDYSSQYYEIEIPKLLEHYLKKTSYTSIADIGCGDGSLLYALKTAGYLTKKKVYGIDLSVKSIALVSLLDPTIHARVDNVEQIKTIPSNSIDFVISTTVIEHVDDQKMLSSVDKILNKSGIAYITTVFKKPYGWYFYRRDGKWVMDVTHLREYMHDDELLHLIDTKAYSILESKKSLCWFPVIDFFARRLKIKDRKFFVNQLFRLLRKIKVPIIGYYEWELVLQKKR